MPVGTRGAVKAVTQRDRRGSRRRDHPRQHLPSVPQPGDGLIARGGGLHRFIGWPRPILTDSGGYQVFSLASTRGRSERRAPSSAPISTDRCTCSPPRRAVDIQAQLGSDIAMVLDECDLPAPAAARRTRAPAMDADRRDGRGARAERQLRRCARRAAVAPDVARRPTPGQAQFGIIQGGDLPGPADRKVSRRPSRSGSRPTRSAA